MRGTQRVAGVVLTLGLALGGCGTGDDQAGSPSPSTTTSTAPAVAAPTSSTTEAPTPAVVSTVTSTPTAQFQCPAIAARAPQPTDQTIPVDFDGDGTSDTLRVYQQGSDWHVRGEAAGDGFVDHVVTTFGPSGVEPIGAARLNPSDATEEAWVKVGSGASTAILTIFVFQGCDLRQPTIGGNPATFVVGASVTHADGVTCFMFDQGVEVFTTTSTDGITYSGQSQLYTLNVTPQPPTLDPAVGWPMPVPAGNPQSHLSALTCGSLTYP